MTKIMRQKVKELQLAHMLAFQRHLRNSYFALNSNNKDFLKE